ncbi:hypothetical protein EDB82DRAFT_12898 [Fusarium venenatum]|uniref:uncharacterized protein n=1 Tax=Fusarium venenatum TaxID=56646 RepID=UPI001D3D9797|nr:hypothetical protein EDB82DRAFT_12898 [Fusarium venenatum]
MEGVTDNVLWMASLLPSALRLSLTFHHPLSLHCFPFPPIVSLLLWSLLFYLGRLLVCLCFLLACVCDPDSNGPDPVFFFFFFFLPPSIKVRLILRFEESLRHLSDWLVKSCGTYSDN